MEIYARLISSGKNKLKDVYLPERFFFLVIKAGPAIPLPLTVTVTEEHDPIISAAGLTVPLPAPGTTSGTLPAGVVDLSSPVTVRRIGSILNYKVSSLSSFEMKKGFHAIQVTGIMSGDVKKAKYYKGSKMKVTVRNGASVLHEETINVNVSNPNNHYHLRGESKFLDGWYFKCLHVDKINRKATPFFFLYGVNKNSLPSNDTAFVLCGNAGSIDMDPTMVKSKVGEPGPIFSFHKRDFLTSSFESEKEYGLNTKIGADFAATDVSCRGKVTPDSGGLVEWDLKFTNIHNSVVTDYNPLQIFDDTWLPIPGYSVHEDISRPLMRYFLSAPGMSAFYMSHNSNAFASGTIRWNEDGVDKTYTFDNDKGYQDSNWGSSGFPHPYVWMQANNFRDSADSPLPGMSIVALFTPGMPMADGELAKIGGICFRPSQSGTPVRFADADRKGWFDTVLDFSGDIIPGGLDVGTITCKVTFAESNGSGVVEIDMLTATEDSLNLELGHFSSRPKKPIKYELTGENDNGDKIEILVTCDYQTQMELSAPKNGVFTPKVTKQTLHGKFRVKFIPDGVTDGITYYSDFGAVDFGD